MTKKIKTALLNTKSVVLLMLITGIIGLTMDKCGQDSLQEGWKKVIARHLEKYPQMQPVDIYKLIFQGVKGPAHLGAEYQTIKNYLQNEISRIESHPGEMIEQIAPDKKYLRINLYNFKYKGGNVDSLAKLVYRSCQEESQSIKKMKIGLQAAGKLIKAERSNLNFQEYKQYLTKIQADNYPVPHHSDLYIEAYQPAYRVISQQVYRKYFDNCFSE
ncbi:MAG TPA: hypothetical protein VKP78_03055 [bacterium]|nr:hypothetical protein [bacterium]